MEVGIHPFIWTAKWDESSLPLINKAKEMGFDFIEVPLVKTDISLARKVRKQLRLAGINCCSTTTGLNQNTDLTSNNANIRLNGIKHLKNCIIDTVEIGCKVFGGVIYSAFGKNVGRPPNDEEWNFSAEGLRKVAKFAKRYGITLAIEPVNRYETYLINTASQSKKLKKMIGEKNVKVRLDTYHMNIEEKDFYKVIKTTGDDLCHIHLCENDRGIPGSGHCDWDGVFKALSEIGYNKTASIESFVSTIPERAAATCIWRKLAPNGDVLAQEGLRFLRNKIKKYKL